MKKLLLSLFICCFAMSIANAQQTAEPESKSKTVEFLSKDGSFLLKDFLESTKVDNIGTSRNRGAYVKNGLGQVLKLRRRA